MPQSNLGVFFLFSCVLFCLLGRWCRTISFFFARVLTKSIIFWLPRFVNFSRRVFLPLKFFGAECWESLAEQIQTCVWPIPLVINIGYIEHRFVYLFGDDRVRLSVPYSSHSLKFIVDESRDSRKCLFACVHYCWKPICFSAALEYKLFVFLLLSWMRRCQIVKIWNMYLDRTESFPVARLWTKRINHTKFSAIECDQNLLLLLRWSNNNISANGFRRNRVAFLSHTCARAFFFFSFSFSFTSMVPFSISK